VSWRTTSGLALRLSKAFRSGVCGNRIFSSQHTSNWHFSDWRAGLGF